MSNVTSTSVTGPVKATETYADDFQSGGYGGSVGSRFWGPDWQEINESDGPSSGDERIVNVDVSLRLRVRDNDGGGEGVSRAVNPACNWRNRKGLLRRVFRRGRSTMAMTYRPRCPA